MSMPPGAMLGGPPPGMPPPDPSMMGGAPPAPQDIVSQQAAVTDSLGQAHQTSMMVLAQLLGQAASPNAIAAQTSPGPLDAAPPPGVPIQ